MSKRKRYGYTKNPHQTIPYQVTVLLRDLQDVRSRSNHAFTAALIAVRDADWGIPAIGAATGIGPLTVARRIFRGRHHPLVQAQLVALDLHIPQAPVPALTHPALAATVVPEHIAEHLRQLQQQGRWRRYGMPSDHPARRAAEHLAADIAGLAKTYSMTQLAKAVGVTMPRVARWIQNHERATANDPAGNSA